MASHIFLLGLNHKTAPVDVRERFALTGYVNPETWLLPQHIFRESLILSTCNRVEIMVVGEHADTARLALETWATTCGETPSSLQPYTYQYQDLEAAAHLFSVASSLDSLVLGEPQILGQLKEAYRLSIKAGATGPILSKLLHKAFYVAKRVRTETAVASSAVSISYAAVELAKRIFDDMPEREALLIGAGEMAELAAMHLVQAGVKRLCVTNRTFARAEELAARVLGEAIPFDAFFEQLVLADIVISSTGAPDLILRVEDMKAVIKKRKHRPMFLIDIAMPRDIDPQVNQLDNMYVYDLDDLKEVVEDNVGKRQSEAQKARGIVEEETKAFGAWLAEMDMQPTMVAIVKRGEAMAQAEVARTLKRLAGNGPVDVATREAIEQMALSLAHKFNHAPLHYLRMQSHTHPDCGGSSGENDDARKRQQSIRTVRQVLGLEE